MLCKREFTPNLTFCDHYFPSVLPCEDLPQKQASGKTPNETRENVDCLSAWKKAK